MTAYELMIKANNYLMKGGTLSDAQKHNIVNQLLLARSTEEQVRRFYHGMRISDNAGQTERNMYPIYFIPPYNEGKKYQTIVGQMPKTHILSANMYELEILRLLYLLAPDNIEVRQMISGTIARLKKTCFGYMDDGVGECFDTSLVVLRFLIAVAPNEVEWIESRIDNYKRHVNDKKRPLFCKRYYEICMAELPAYSI